MIGCDCCVLNSKRTMDHVPLPLCPVGSPEKRSEPGRPKTDPRVSWPHDCTRWCRRGPVVGGRRVGVDVSRLQRCPEVAGWKSIWEAEDLEHIGALLLFSFLNCEFHDLVVCSAVYSSMSSDLG